MTSATTPTNQPRKGRKAQVQWHFLRSGGITLTYRGRKIFRGTFDDCSAFLRGWEEAKPLTSTIPGALALLAKLEG